MKTYPTWDHVPHDKDGLLPELVENYAVHCVNAYPKLVAALKKHVALIPDRATNDLLKELGELE